MTEVASNQDRRERRGLNLARQPFRNLRPIRRLAALLWLVGGVLLVINIVQYWGYFTGSEDRGAELEQLQAQIAEHREEIASLESRFRSLDLRSQNAEVRFLNRKIEERTFSWSELFDRLADVLPNDVRLVSLSPATQRSERSRARERQQVLTDGEIELGIVGVARTPEAQLEFIEALFAHAAFRDPDLSRDSLAEGQIRFNMSTVYLPDRPEQLRGDLTVPGLPISDPTPDGNVRNPVVIEEIPVVYVDPDPARSTGANPRAPNSRAPRPSTLSDEEILDGRAQEAMAAQDAEAGPPVASSQVLRPPAASRTAPRGQVPNTQLPSNRAPSSTSTATRDGRASSGRPIPRQPNASSTPEIR